MEVCSFSVGEKFARFDALKENLLHMRRTVVFSYIVVTPGLSKLPVKEFSSG